MDGNVVEDMRCIAGKKFDPSKVDLLLNEVHPGKDQEVPDPFYGPEPGYHKVYNLISEAADKIITKYTGAASSGSTEGQTLNKK